MKNIKAIEIQVSILPEIDQFIQIKCRKSKGIGEI